MNPADLFRKTLQFTKEFMTPRPSGAFQKPQNQTETQVRPESIDNDPLDKIKPFLSVLSRAKEGVKELGGALVKTGVVGIGASPADMFRSVLNSGRTLEIKSEKPEPTIIDKIGEHETKVKYLGGDPNDKKNYTTWKNEAERYAYVRPGSGHLGYYQVSPETFDTYMDDIFPERFKKGAVKITKNEFLNSPQMQRQFIEGLRKRWDDQYGQTEEEFAKYWHGGIKSNPNRPDNVEYARKVLMGE